MQGHSIVHSSNSKSIPGKIIQLAGKHRVGGCVCLRRGSHPGQDHALRGSIQAFTYCTSLLYLVHPEGRTLE